MMNSITVTLEFLEQKAHAARGNLKMAWNERYTTTSAIPGSYRSQGQANEL